MINYGMALIAAILYGAAWSMHHFKDSIRFGKLAGRLLGGKAPGADQIKELYERGIAVVVGAATAAAVIAATGALARVWTWAAAGTNVLALLGADILLGIWAYHMILRGNKHHPVRTNAVAALCGIAFALTWGGWTGLGPAVGKAVTAVGKTSGNAMAGNAATGIGGHGHHAAHTAAAAAGSGAAEAGAVVFLVVVVFLLVTVIRSYRKERKPGKSQGKGQGQGQGRGQAALDAPGFR